MFAPWIFKSSTTFRVCPRPPRCPNHALYVDVEANDVVAFRELPIVPENLGDVRQVCVVESRRACATSYDDNDGIGDDDERATTRPQF